MTTETTPIETKKIPGVPDKALVKAAGLSCADVRISWTLDEDGNKKTQALFLESGKEIIASNNTLLVAKMMDVIADLQSKLEEASTGV
jgi:hypothetical protein